MPIDAAVLLARFLLATVFLPNGILKLTDIAGTAGYFGGLGLPAPLLLAWATGLFELTAGLCVVAGFRTRIAALLLGAFCLVAGFLGHAGQGGDDPMLAFMHMQALLKDIGLAGGFLALALAGPGRFSLDNAARAGGTPSG
jgi:putative oxidoreductase